MVELYQNRIKKENPHARGEKCIGKIIGEYIFNLNSYQLTSAVSMIESLSSVFVPVPSSFSSLR